VKGLDIKWRLTALLVAIVAAMTLLSAGGLWRLRQLSASLDSFYADRLLPMQQLQRIQQNLLAANLLSVGRLLEGDDVERARRELTANNQAARRDWAEYKRTQLVERERQLAARAEPLLARVLAQADKLAGLPRGDAMTEAARQLQGELRQADLPLGRLLSELADVQLVVARQQSEDGQDALARTAWLTLGLLLGTGALGAAMAYGLWRRYADEQAHALAARLRLQRFYKALSETNQLIVHGAADVPALYAGLCRICVETGHASLASVVLLDGKEFVRTAMHGPAELLMPGVPQRWALQSRFGASSLSTQAISQNRHVISNRAMQDPRLLQPAAPLIPPGVEAMAALVLRRAGQPIGALSLLAPEAGFFDEALLALLDEMVSDVSFALDNVDRERAREQALAEARQHQALFSALFHASPVSAVLARADTGEVLELNERLCQRYELPREALLGKRLSSLGVGLLPADQAQFNELLKRDGRVRSLQGQVRSSSGRLLHALVDAVLLDYQGQPCVLATSVDITELRAAQALAASGGGAATGDNAAAHNPPEPRP